MAAVTAPTTDQATRAGRSLLAGILLGLGTVAFFDETVFHQLLHWHHFYDRSTTDAGLVSDGLFHAFSWFATVGALFLVADLRRERASGDGGSSRAGSPVPGSSSSTTVWCSTS